MRRPIIITTLLIAGIVGFTETNAQTTKQITAKEFKGKKTAEFTKLRPDDKMPDAFYNSAGFNAFYNANQHLSEADYQEAYHNFLNPTTKAPKPIFINTGNPGQDRTNYKMAKKEWLKKNSPYDYWREQENSSEEQKNQ